MPDKLLNLIPFILTVEGRHRFNTARIIEAIIIAVIGGSFAGYIAMAKMEVKLTELEKAVVETKQDMKQFYRDFYVPRGNR